MRALGSILTGVLLMAGVRHVQAQGMNNQYPVDSIDILNTMAIRDINVFKFPVQAPVKGTQYYLNYVLDVYENSEHSKSASLLDTMLVHLPAAHRNSPALAQKLFKGYGVGDSSRLIRIYTERRTPDEMTLGFGFDTQIQIITLSIDTTKYDMANARAMDYSGVKLNGTTPLVVYYMNTRGENILNCPGNASIDEIAERYDFAVIISSELRPIGSGGEVGSRSE